MYLSCLTVFRKYKIYSNDENIFIIGINKKEDIYEITKLAKTKEIKIDGNFQLFKKNLYHNFLKENNLTLLCKCEGILGCIKFLNFPYLYVLTKKEKVAYLFNEHKIYMVKNVLLIPFKENIFENYNEENELIEIFYNNINNKYLYFSYTYNLSNCVQDNYFIQKEFLKGNVIYNKNYKNHYIWNFYHCKHFVKNNLFICVFLINGYLTQSKFYFSGRYIDITFIARRCSKYAGTRYRKRGINSKGFSANEVESEFILFEKNNFNAILSYVQLRGSIPIFWRQTVNYKLLKKPKIRFLKSDINYTCSKNHFKLLFEKYGYPITVVNLLSKNKYTDENILSKEYKKCIDSINKKLPKKIQIIYKHLDLRKAYNIGSKYTQNNLKLLFNFSQNNIGFFYINNFKLILVQRGVLRFNCVDCLDRTNAAQLFINIYIFIKFLKLIKLIKRNNLSINVISHLSQLYEQLGDAISKQYAGSTAHKKYTTGQNKNIFIQSKELFTSIKRHYISSFNDLEKQKSINLYLGVINSKLKEIKNSNDLDNFIHNKYFKDNGNNIFWWVLPLEHFYYKVESLLDLKKKKKKDKRKIIAHKKKSILRKRKNIIKINNIHKNNGINYNISNVLEKNYKSHRETLRKINRCNTSNNFYTTKKIEQKKIISNMYKNLRFYRCFSNTNIFKHLYNANKLHWNFNEKNISSYNSNNWFNSYFSNNSNSLISLYEHDEKGYLNKFFYFLNCALQLYKFYNVYKNNFHFFFKKKNIFRFKIWRLIACYNYLNYLKIYFNFFFLFYYSIFTNYNIKLIFLHHINILSQKSDLLDNYNYYVINGNTYEKDAKKIVQYFKEYKNISLLLKSYLNYYEVCRLSYSYMLINISSIIKKKKKNKNNGIKKKTYKKFKKSLMKKHTKNMHNNNGEYVQSLVKNSNSMNILDKMHNQNTKEFYISKTKIERKKKNKKKFFSSLCNYSIKNIKYIQKYKKKEEIFKMPYIYCPIYFNMNLIKLFFFIYGHYCNDKNNNVISELKEAIYYDHYNQSIYNLYNAEFFLKKLLFARCINNFFSELYLSYIYKTNYYKKLNLSFYQHFKSSFYNNIKHQKSSEEKLFLEEYDSFENISKKKKEVLMIDKKISNKVKQNYNSLSNNCLLIKNFNRKYFSELKCFIEKDQKIKNYLKNITTFNNQMNDYDILLNDFKEYVKFNQNKKKQISFYNISDFNVLQDKIENQMNYHHYCNPINREIFLK